VQGMDHEAELVTTGEEGLQRMGKQSFDLVISDVHMEPVSGFDLLEQTLSRHPQTRVVLFSGDKDPELMSRAMATGAMSFLPKPIRIDLLKTVLDKAREPMSPLGAHQGTAPRPAAELAQDFEAVVSPFYPGPGLKVVRQRLSWVAQARSHVLLDARPGVLNREVLEAFHHHSPFAGRPLRIVNLETEDANELRVRLSEAPAAWLDEMSGGTLVLLALDALPLDVQGTLAGLLRKDFKGRIIATVRGDPDTLVGEMKLNDGLYFRLALFSTRIAPLSEAGEALPRLLADAVAASNAWLGGGPPDVNRETKAALMAYAWPQNHFELRRVADQIASRLEPGQAIQLDHLPNVVAGANWAPLADHLRMMANAYIKRVESTMPDRARTAEVLGVRLESLERHLSDSDHEMFSLDVDPRTMVPWAVEKPLPDTAGSDASSNEPNKVERILVIGDDPLERANLVGRLAAANREIVEAKHALAAISELGISPNEFSFALVMPPCAGLSVEELGEQLKRISPKTGTALFYPFAPVSAREAFDVVRERPETALEFTELFESLRRKSR
jgi:DNA-binding NtrC family response regulator